MNHNAEMGLMDRRRFILRAGTAAAGSALGLTLTGCDNKPPLVIPCLAVVTAPVPVAGMTYIQASQIGCALDCNLENGRNKYTGGEATDDAPHINAAMAGATASNPITLIIDGSALVSGLFLPAGGYWSIAGLGCGTGFFKDWREQRWHPQWWPKCSCAVRSGASSPRAWIERNAQQLHGERKPGKRVRRRFDDRNTARKERRGPVVLWHQPHEPE